MLAFRILLVYSESYRMKRIRIRPNEVDLDPTEWSRSGSYRMKWIRILQNEADLDLTDWSRSGSAILLKPNPCAEYFIVCICYLLSVSIHDWDHTVYLCREKKTNKCTSVLVATSFYACYKISPLFWVLKIAKHKIGIGFAKWLFWS